MTVALPRNLPYYFIYPSLFPSQTEGYTVFILSVRPYVRPLRFILLYSLSEGSHYENVSYSNILKILPPKDANFQIRNSDILHISTQKHRSWVLVRTASARRF